MGKLATAIAVTMVIPDAHRGRLQVVRDYQAAMHAVGHTGLGTGSLEGYVNTRVLAEGLARAGRDVSRAICLLAPQAIITQCRRFLTPSSSRGC